MLPKSGAVAADPAPVLNSLSEACRRPSQAGLLHGRGVVGVFRLFSDECGLGRMAPAELAL